MPREFPFDKQYDFAFRPRSYWPELPDEQSVLAQVKGTVRRRVARDVVAGKREAERGEADFVLEESLEPDTREAWGQLHPQMMGGEYLPDFEDNEVEVARVELESVTGDVLQLRAWRDGRQIRFRVVDEYEEDDPVGGVRYKVSPDVADKPLSFGDLIDLIDGTRRVGGLERGSDRYDVGLIDGILNGNVDDGAEPRAMRFFFRVESAFYPQLGRYYDERLAHWLREEVGMPAEFVTETEDGVFVAFAVVEDAASWPDIEMAEAAVEVEPLHKLEGGSLVLAVEGADAGEVERAALRLGRPATSEEINR